MTKRRGIRPAYHPREGFKDDANTSQALEEINREYLKKEHALKSNGGPAPIPGTPHYEKSFRVKPRKGE